jgi:hypothetical protein
MHSKVVSLAIVIALGLIHFSYVDFRFRHRGSVMWFWLMTPASRFLWVSRAAVAAAFVVAIATAFVGVGLTAAILLVGLLVIHIATLIAVEVREEDWPPTAIPPE